MSWQRNLLLTIIFAAIPAVAGIVVAQAQISAARVQGVSSLTPVQSAPPPATLTPVPVIPVIAPPPPPPPDVNTGPIQLSATEYQLVSSQLKTLVDQQDPKAALAKLADLMNTDKAVLRSCHGLAHAIGHWGYQKYGSFQAAIAYTDDVCGNGYMHGVIEEDFVNVSDIVTAMTNLCQPGQWGCFHAIGHGLMYYKQNDIPTALPLCDNLKDGKAIGYCTEGVFMENFETNTQVHQAKYLHPDDPFYPCYQEPARYKDVCYYYSGRYLVRLHQYDYIGALQHCAKTPDAANATSCARGVGAVTVRENLSDPKGVEFICSQGPVPLVSSCIYGAMSYYSVTYQSAEKTRTDFCGNFSSPFYKNMCVGFTSPS